MRNSLKPLRSGKETPGSVFRKQETGIRATLAAGLQLVLLAVLIGIVGWLLSRPAPGETTVRSIAELWESVQRLWPLSLEVLNRDLADASLPLFGLLLFFAWLVSWAALGLSRRFPVAATWLLASMLYLVTIVVPLLFANAVLVGGLALLLIIALTSGRVFKEELTARLMVFAIGASMIALGFDIFVSWSRPTLFPDNIYLWASIVIAFCFSVVIAIGFRHYPLRQKLILVVTAVSMVSIAVVAIVSITSTQASIRGTASQALLTASYQAGASVDSFLRNARETLISEAQLPQFAEYLALPSDLKTPEVTGELDQLMRQLLVAKRSSAALSGSLQSYIVGYSLLNANGIVVRDTDPQFNGSDVSQSNYFGAGLASELAYISPVIFDRTNVPVLFVATRVYDSRRLVMGVLVARFNGLVLQQIIYESNDLAGQGAYGILIDNRYDIILANGRYSQLDFKTLIPVDVTTQRDFVSQSLLPSRPGVPISTNQLELSENLQRMKPLYEDFVARQASLTERQPDLTQQQLAEEQADLSLRELGLTFNFVELVSSNQQLAAYSELGFAPWSVIYTQSEAYFLTPVANQVRNIQLLAIVVAFIAAGMAVILSQVLAAPIGVLTNVAGSIQAGDLTVRAPVETSDEIGQLSETINAMASQLQQTLTGLEQRVDDRTRDLARRSSELQAAAEVGRTAANLRNINELLPRVSQLISERFGYYHVGVFLLDESGRFAVLRAANSEGGRRMLDRGHRLAVGQQGIVGFVTSTGQPRIALDVGSDAVFFNNPDLPLTRSEMALPLVSGGRLFGALDVQSTEPSAFTTQDLTVLQVMADLIAVAIENARLFEDSQQALEATRRAYGEISSKGWEELLRSQQIYAFTSRAVAGRDQASLSSPEVQDTVPVQTEMTAVEGGSMPADKMKPQPLSIPIWVRETVVGYLETSKPAEKGPWTEDEIDTITHVIEQVGVALEGARLYHASQAQAERERLIAEVTTRMRESLDVDAVLQVAAKQIRQALKLNAVTISLAGNGQSDNGSDQSSG